MDQLNIKSSNLKPNPINTCTHNVWICFWQQLEGYHYSKLEEIDRYVPFGDSHGYGTLCYDRTVAPRGCNNAGLVGCKLQELFHKICMFTMNIL
jgi:hypothetical protein